MALVLVIEENPLLRRALGATLRRLGLAVALAEGGDEGIRQYRQLNPDLVITELLMRDKDGIETLWEIRAINPAAKVIAIVDHLRGRFDYRGVVRRLGADDVLSKPITTDGVVRVLANCLPSEASRQLPIAV